MNRVIKFRAWDKHSKRMRPVSEISWDWRAIHHIRTDTYTLALNGISGYMADESGADLPLSLDRHPEPIMQYTGRTDKKGKEVYEGDIYTDGYRYSDGTHKYGDRNVVEDIRTFSPCDEIEVIGNIYENPDLLSHDT